MAADRGLMHSYPSLRVLNDEVTTCRRCPRLVEYRESVPPRKSFENQTYWRKPVPGFGDPKAWLLITGLAPSAHGGNRTGRIFTGDGSGAFLFDGLYRAGFANQPTAEAIDDGLTLKGCYITAAVKCAPPDNRPTIGEFKNCSFYYHEELRLLTHVTHVLVLGRSALWAYQQYVKSHTGKTPRCPFVFGAQYQLEDLPTVVVSYHPSPQNTNTGKLTQAMFTGLLKSIRE